MIEVKLVLDSNAIIDFLKERSAAFDLAALVEEHECFVSVIAKLELLKSPNITPDEERKIFDFLELIPVLPLNTFIEDETIALSRSVKLKLPDAIIAATAIVIGAELVSSDTDFLKCAYPLLKIWQSNKS
jgi:predicted nucleic acid-binding protein